ncbi:MAG TPA: hypothetical protein VFO01_14725, partial [Trebonia sp.]|nr:hypothetical protein [Trebonia sp.]
GDVLLAATRLSAAAGFDRHTWHLTSTLEIFLQRLGRWQEQAGICELALAATRRLGDQAALAAALRMSSRRVCGRAESPPNPVGVSAALDFHPLPTVSRVGM